MHWFSPVDVWFICVQTRTVRKLHTFDTFIFLFPMRRLVIMIERNFQNGGESRVISISLWKEAVNFSFEKLKMKERR